MATSSSILRMLARSVMFAAESDGRAARGEAGAGDADAGPVLVGDLVRGRLGGVLVQVDAGDVGALPGEAEGGLPADAGAGADHDDHLAGELLLGGHAPELRLLEEPVLDVEGLLLGKRACTGRSPRRRA